MLPCASKDGAIAANLGMSLSVPNRARVLLEHLYDVYKEDGPASEPQTPKPSATASVFLNAIHNLSSADQKAAISELEAYFNGTNPCLDGDALWWWKMSPTHSILHDISIDSL